MRKRIIFGSILVVLVLFFLPMNSIIGQVEQNDKITTHTKNIQQNEEEIIQRYERLLVTLETYEQILKNKNPELYNMYLSEFKCESCLEISPNSLIEMYDTMIGCILTIIIGILFLIVLPPIGWFFFWQPDHGAVWLSCDEA